MKSTTNTTLELSAQFDRSLIWQRGRSVRYLVAEIKCDAPGGEAPLPLNLAFVIDASGSMTGDRIEAAKEAAIRIVDQLEERDHLSVVTFDTEPQVVAAPTKCDASGRNELKKLLRSITAGSSTNLSGGWLLGAESVASFEGSGTTQNHVLLLSDGHANVGILETSELALHSRELAARGVTTSAVGIGDDYSPTQLNAISDSGGGRTHDAERPHEIAEVVGGELSDLRGTVLEDVRMDVWAPESVDLELVSAFATGDSTDGLEIRLGSLSASSTRRVIIRATCPARMTDATIQLGVEVAGKEVSTKQQVSSNDVPATLSFAGGRDNSMQSRNKAIATLVAGEWQGHAIRRAVELNRAGDLSRASRYLMSQLKHFKRYCSGLPEEEQLVADFELAARRMASPMEERSLKEVAMAYRMTSRNEKDYRVHQRMAPREFLKK